MDQALSETLAQRGWRADELLKDDAVSCVWKLESPEGALLLKRSRMFGVLFGIIPAWLTAREVRILRALEGVDGIPRVYERLDRSTFVREFVEAQPLDRCEELPEPFFPLLVGQLRAIHARGVACVDLSKRENILVSDAGTPVLMDFQAGLALRPGRWTARVFGPLLRALQRGDLHHVYKHHRRRFSSLPIPPTPPELAQEPLGIRLHRVLLRRPYLWVKRSLSRRSG